MIFMPELTELQALQRTLSGYYGGIFYENLKGYCLKQAT